MAALRLGCLVLALLGFFLIGTPLQWLVARRAPRAAHAIPLVFCRSLLRLLRVRLEIEGSYAADRPVLMAANHVSWIDILALGAVTPFCFLAKGEVAGWPILSAFAEVQGTVFVDRRRRRSIPPANRAMARRMLAGRPVMLFPEGTTVGGGEPGRFRSSHFAAAHELLRERADHDRVDVQPVAISYSSPLAAWVGDDALLPHLWRVLRAPPLICSIGFLAPLACGRTTDRKTMARDARAAVAARLAEARLAPVSLATGAAIAPMPHVAPTGLR